MTAFASASPSWDTQDQSPTDFDADDLAPLAGLIALGRRSERIVAFTGAGISTESGIPDYRGPGGVWERNAAPILSDFQTNPSTRREYWRRRRTGYRKLADAMPNQGHRALAALATAGRVTAVITQNIDGLHQKAGNDPDQVIELHGTAHRVRCLDCGTTWPASAIQDRLVDSDDEPRCERCGGPLRGATILFGESLPADALQRAVEAARDCDLMLVVGSSLIVKPAAQLPLLAKRVGAGLAIVNRTDTPLDQLADVRIEGEAGPTLGALATALLGDGWDQRSWID
ncbi:MAG: SIR2 family NAD-dependent protein deacylase [Thermomicrobiales bacterium]